MQWRPLSERLKPAANLLLVDYDITVHNHLRNEYF